MLFLALYRECVKSKKSLSFDVVRMSPTTAKRFVAQKLNYYCYYERVTPAGNTRRYYIPGGVRRRGKEGKHGKVGVKRKW